MPRQSSNSDFAFHFRGFEFQAYSEEKIPRALGTKTQNIKQKQYCNKSKKDLKKRCTQPVMANPR